MKENELRRDFKKMTPPDAHYQRIEDKLSIGIPDVNVCYGGKEFWVELKSIAYVEGMKRLNVGMRPAQISWITARALSGGNVYILLQLYGRDSTQWWLLPANMATSLHRPISIKQIKLYKGVILGKNNIKEFMYGGTQRI